MRDWNEIPFGWHGLTKSEIENEDVRKFQGIKSVMKKKQKLNNSDGLATFGEYEMIGKGNPYEV